MTERNTKLDEHLNESYPEVKIWNLTFSPADIIYNLDETAYRCMCSDLWYDDEDEYLFDDENDDE